LRYWLPGIAAAACLVGTLIVPPAVGWVLLIAAFGLLLDVATALFERAGGTGGLHDHHQ
jgi:hypothetical protein